MEDGPMDRVVAYREYCSELERMAEHLSREGEFIVAAHLQAALDALRASVIELAAGASH